MEYWPLKWPSFVSKYSIHGASGIYTIVIYSTKQWISSRPIFFSSRRCLKIWHLQLRVTKSMETLGCLGSTTSWSKTNTRQIPWFQGINLPIKWAIKNTPIPSHYTSWLIGFPILWAIIIPSKPGSVIPYSNQLTRVFLMAQMFMQF